MTLSTVMKVAHKKIYAVMIAILLTTPCFSQNRESDQSGAEIKTSPKSVWRETVFQEDSKPDPWWAHVLLWVPNRVMDFIDIFKVDVGVGSSLGGVARVSKYAQVGYRKMDPLSVRVGVMGRRAPVMVERSGEKGVSPNYVQSKDRKVCIGEVGAGLDLFIVAFYGGICTDEIVDFGAGLFFIDPAKDDIR